MNLSLSEKSYIAGIIDGEGSIMLIRNNPNEHPSPCISVASTTTELLDYLMSTIGSGSIKSKKNYSPDRHQKSYSYVLRGDKSLALLNEIHPYLVISSKKKRSALLINNYKKLTKRNGRYTSDELFHKVKLYEDFIAIK